jgi:hypothetical protein
MQLGKFSNGCVGTNVAKFLEACLESIDFCKGDGPVIRVGVMQDCGA